MNIVITIPINIETSLVAERLIDWIYQLNQREKCGHALLVYADVHEEHQMRLRIAAELAFQSFDEIVVPNVDKPDNMESPMAKRNRTFLVAAEYCQKTYRVPWLYLDPTSVPLKRGWLTVIEDAFLDQPRRYMGTHLRPSAESKEVFLMPTSVYHMGAFNDCHHIVTDAMAVPFEISCGPTLAPKSTKSRLIQPLRIQDETDFDKIWDEAAVVVGDMSGALIEKLREEGRHLPIPEKIHVETVLGYSENHGCKNPILHLRKQNSESDKNPDSGDVHYSTPTSRINERIANGKIKLDLRTKEGRALKAKLKAEGKA